MKVKAIMFDLDDTLIKSAKTYDRALEFAARFLSEKYKLDHAKFIEKVKEKHFIVSKNFPTVHTRHSRILVFRMALDEMIHDKYDLSVLPEVEDMYWSYFLKNIELFDHVKETLAKLRSIGIKLAIVSDGDLSLRLQKAKVAGVLEYMEELVASEEVIFEKPFSAIFTLALSRLHVDPKNALMVGNDYKNDIRGAQLVGVRGVLFDPLVDSNAINQDGTIVPDYTIKDIAELLDIVGIK